MSYEVNSAIFTPNDSTILWRYMSPLKLFNLLETQTLFFTNASLFTDNYEGQLPQRMLQMEQEILSKTGGLPLNDLLNCYRNVMLVNCWYEHWRDTEYMWGQYGNEIGSVAIKTNVGSLKRSLVDNCGIHIGKIYYIDYEKDMFQSANPEGYYSIYYSPYFHKRNKFDDEREVRAIINTVDRISGQLTSRGLEPNDLTPSIIEEIGKQLFPKITHNV